jgi:hypothetical protein
MYYIYHYVDPRTNLPFYVGKGQGDRCYDHLHETEENTENRHKFYKIQFLKNSGYDIVIIKVIENIEDEIVAYNLETEEILKYGRIGFEENGILTNICLGQKPPSPKGKIKSEEHRRHLSESHKGKKVSDITKKKNSEITKKRLENKEFGHNIPHSAETKRKISDSKKNKKEHWYNNGITSIKVGENNIPDGFIKGRLVGKRGKYNKDPRHE